MKKGISIGIAISIIVIITVFAASWFVGSETKDNTQIQTTNATKPIGHSYHLNLTESVGIHAQP